MSFSAGGYNFETAALSEKASRGKSHSDFVAYVATNGGAVDPAAAASAAYGYYKANFPDLILQFAGYLGIRRGFPGTNGR